MRFYRLVFNRDEKVTFVSMGLNEKKKFKMAPNLTQIKIPKSESSSPAQCPQDYLCQIWCNCDERKYAQKCEKWHFFLNTENVVDGKFKDRNRDTNCSTLSVFAIGRKSQVLQFFYFSDLGMTLTLTFKVKVTRPHWYLSNKKKIIDLSHTVTEIYALEVYTYYIGPMLQHSKTLKAHNFLTAGDNLAKAYIFLLHSSRTII